MKELLFYNLSSYVNALSVQEIVLNFLAAIILGLVIFLSYKYSHSGAVYSSRFNVSLLMITFVTTLVMSVIGNNVALSLGMVGALSIVRFRTPIKDPRDATYLFWGIAVGICCGVSEYIIASIGSGVIFLMLLLLGGIKSNDRYLLVVHGARMAESEIETMILTSFEGGAIMRVMNSTRETCEYIYELSKKMLDKNKEQNGLLTEKLYKIEGVQAVNIVCQNEEVSR